MVERFEVLSLRGWSSLLVGLLALGAAHAQEIVVSGRLLDPAGQALAEARVDLVPVPDQLDRARLELAGKVDAPAAASTQTDKNGFFLLAAPHDGMWKVQAEAPDLVPLEYELLPLVESTSLPAVRLGRDAGLVVELRTPDGRPLAGGRVRVSPAEAARSRFYPRPDWQVAERLTLTDENGRARLPRLAGESLRVEATGPGFGERTLVGVRRSKLSLELPAAVPRTFEVRRPGDTPAAGVVVWLGDGRSPVAESGTGGKLLLPLPTAGAVSVRLQDDDGYHMAARLSTQVESEDGEARILRLEPPTRLRGRVVARADAAPIPEAFVWPGSDPGAAVRTDRQGGYAYAGPAFETDYLRATAPRFFRDANLVASSPGDVVDVPTLALYSRVTIHGRVVDGQGSPLSGVEIRTDFDVESRPRRFPQLALSGDWSWSRADGGFEVSNLLSDVAYRVRCTAPGFAPAEVVVPEPGKQADDLVVVLREGLEARGRVLDEDEEPVAGATVRLRTVFAPDSPLEIQALVEPERLAAWETSTAADGTYLLQDLPAGRFDLEVSARGYVETTVPGIVLSDDEGAADLGTVVLTPGVAVTGRVVDPRGEAVEGVEVRVMPASSLARMVAGFKPEVRTPDAFTGFDGTFLVPDRRPGDRLELFFRRTGYSSRTVSGVEVPAAEPLRIVLRSAVQVAGRVVDLGGRGVGGAVVTLDSVKEESGAGMTLTIGGLHSETTQADDEGHFVFAGVDAGRVRLTASASGFETVEIKDLAVSESLGDVEIVLPSGASVTGHVFDPEGTPIVGARISRFSAGAAPAFIQDQVRSQGTSDGDGAYRLEGIPEGRQSLLAEHERHGRIVRDVVVERGENVFDLRFEGGWEVRGRVFEASAAPIEGAAVLLRAEGLGSGNRRTTSDMSGAFVFSGVTPGRYEVVVRKPGWARAAPVEVDVLDGPVEDLDVVLELGGAIVGRIYGLGLDELKAVEVGAGGATGTVSYDGSYRVADLAPGTWSVTARLGSRQAQGEVTLEPVVPEAVLDLSFGEGWTLSGVVLLGGVPLADGRVFLRRVGSPALSTELDSGGSFRFSGLETGTYEVEVVRRQTGLEHRETVDVSADHDLEIALVAAEVHGKVVDARDESPLGGVRVTLERTDAPEGLFARGLTSDARGTFVFPEVAQGTWRVLASKNGYEEEAETVVVDNPEPRELRVELKPTEGIAAEVSFPSGLVPRMVHAAAIDRYGRVAGAGSYPTTEGGRLTLPSVPPGEWELLLTADGTATWEGSVVSTGEVVRAVLPAPGKVVVYAPDFLDSSARVSLVRQDGRPFRRVELGGQIVTHWALREGTGRIDGVNEGLWLVRVEQADGRFGASEARVVAGSIVEVTVEPVHQVDSPNP